MKTYTEDQLQQAVKKALAEAHAIFSAGMSEAFAARENEKHRTDQAEANLAEMREIAQEHSAAAASQRARANEVVACAQKVVEQVPVDAQNGGMHDSTFIKVWGDAEGGSAGRIALAEYAYKLGCAASQQTPMLTVWNGPMPESNGASNFTATLMRKGASMFDTNSYTFSRSEYPDRVRYEADCMRFLIGELAVEPFILDYDSEKHSGFKPPLTTKLG